MSDLNRHRAYIVWGIAIVSVALVGVLALVPSGAWIALDQRRSSERTTPDGVAAWARSLDRLGVPVAPRYRSLTAEPPRSGGLAILEAVLPPTALEAHEALEWVRAGGVLVYSPGRAALILDSLGLFLSGRFASELPPDELQPHPWTGDGTFSDFGSRWTFQLDSMAPRTWTPLAVAGVIEDEDEDDRGVTLAWLPEGEGGVLVVTDGEALANRSLAGSGLAVTLARALADLLAEGDTLFFSEYHQGLDGRRGALRETYAVAVGSPWGRPLLVAAGAGVLLLLVGGRRFGDPLAEPPGRRRSTLEHVEALAHIYRAAGSNRTAARHLVRGAARRMGRPPTADDPESELIAWGTRPDLTEDARAALAALRSDPPELHDLERALDALVRHHDSLPRAT